MECVSVEEDAPSFLEIKPQFRELFLKEEIVPSFFCRGNLRADRRSDAHVLC
jgi:hypothetical protein